MIRSNRNLVLHIGLALVLFSAVFAVYAPSLHGDFIWDDEAYISQNNALSSLQGLHDIWFKPGSVQQYYPVTFTVFWVAHHLWGLNPLGYHALNVILHGANAFLIGILLEGIGLPGAWITAWLFALHPVQAESAAWMTELKNVLSTFFYLLTLIMLFQKSRTAGSRRRTYITALFLFALALLSKSVTMSLPVCYVLIESWRQGSWDKRKVISMLPFLALGLGAAAYTAYYEHHLVRAQGPMWALSMPQRVVIAGHAFWFYLRKLFLPSSLSFIYPRWSVPADLPISYWLWPVTAIGFLALAAYGRKWWGKLPFACLLFYALTIAPALGLTSFYFMRFSFVADHFQYLASIGVLTLVGWSLAVGLKKMGTPLPSPIAVAIVLMLAINLGMATARQSQKYEDAFQLWDHTLALNPDSAIAHHNMGIALAQRGQWNLAVSHLRTAEALDPTFPQTHLALAYLAANAQRWDDARHQYQEAIRCGIDDPDLLLELDWAIRRHKPVRPTRMLGPSDPLI